jgi:hypothetical protein
MVVDDWLMMKMSSFGVDPFGLIVRLTGTAEVNGLKSFHEYGIDRSLEE